LYETGADGFYTFPSVNGGTTLSASKEGYRRVFVQATLKGDTWLNIELVKQ
jgi:hypothetical protein